MARVNRTKLTVLMSVFNDQGYLTQAIESILGQSYSDFEFLIIDDGSTQDLEALSSFSDSRIVIHRQANIGLTRSLNKGIAMASGEFIARMDADDISAPERLQAQISEIESDPKLDLVGSFFEIVDDQGMLIERKELITDPIYRLWRLQFHNNYGHGTVMFRKKAVMDVGMYNESLMYAQDFDLWSRLSQRNNTSVVPEVLYSYRLIQHGQQASVKNYDAQLATAIDISNRSLAVSNPLLSHHDCKEIRALYWKFQLNEVTTRGLELIPSTLDGFCSRYGVNGNQRQRLEDKVRSDISNELKQIENISIDER
jgi:glycosyltransferase involved in cell wall biosynthesis